MTIQRDSTGQILFQFQDNHVAACLFLSIANELNRQACYIPQTSRLDGVKCRFVIIVESFNAPHLRSTRAARTASGSGLGYY